MPVDWGDVPAWVGGVLLTGVSLLLTAFELRQRVRDTRSKAARQVWVLCEGYHYGDTASNECEAVVLNDSDEPVFECWVHLLNWDWASTRRVMCGRIFPSVPPHSKSGPVSLHPVETPRLTNARRPPLEVEFTDGRGVRWRRTPDAHLQKVTPSKPVPNGKPA